jgi:hypothetical protein
MVSVPLDGAPNAVTGNHSPARRQPIRVLADFGPGLLPTVVAALWASSKRQRRRRAVASEVTRSVPSSFSVASLRFRAS